MQQLKMSRNHSPVSDCDVALSAVSWLLPDDDIPDISCTTEWSSSDDGVSPGISPHRVPSLCVCNRGALDVITNSIKYLHLR